MSASESSVNANRYDPYRNFKFRVRWEGKIVAGISKVGGLTRATLDYGPIKLERGVTHDLDFEVWANKVWSYGNSAGQEASLKDFRKDIIIEQYDEAGRKVIVYNVYRCWVSEYTAMSELDASGNAVAIQSITLQHEGWERNMTVAEPEEPGQ